MNFDFDLEQFRNLLNAAKEKGLGYAGVAMDKTKDAARLAKLTMSLASEKEAAKKVYTELGKAFYEEHRASAEGLFAQLCEELEATTGRIDEIQKEIDELKADLTPAKAATADFEEVVSQSEEPDIVVEVTEEPAEETPEE